MIPKIIHQTWRSKTLPDVLENIYIHNKSINPDFEFNLWSHAPGEPEIDNFLEKEYPELYNIFKKTKFGVQKGDIARLAILYHYGGIYIDLDILCIKSFDKLIDFNSDKLKMAYEPPEQTIKIFNTHYSLCNAFVAVPKEHPILKFAMDGIISNYNKYGDILFNKFDVFGGGFIQNIINAVPNMSSKVDIINHDNVFPINDPKFVDLPCSRRDWERLKSGYYGGKAILVHYWIHCDFEGQRIIDKFKCDKNKSIHTNLFEFFCELYPENYKKLICLE